MGRTGSLLTPDPPSGSTSLPGPVPRARMGTAEASIYPKTGPAAGDGYSIGTGTSTTLQSILRMTTSFTPPGSNPLPGDQVIGERVGREFQGLTLSGDIA